MIGYLHKVETKNSTALCMPSHVDGGKRPVQYDGRTDDILEPAAAYEGITVGDVNLEKANKTCYSWYTSDYAGH